MHRVGMERADAADPLLAWEASAASFECSQGRDEIRIRRRRFAVGNDSLLHVGLDRSALLSEGEPHQSTYIS